MKKVVLAGILWAVVFIGNLIGQTARDSIITEDYFGFDFWGINKSLWIDVFMQMENDDFPFGLVGTDAINWQKIEPEHPENGIHKYHWEPVDTLMRIAQMAGKKFDIGLRPLSDWGTVLPASEVPYADWALVMSPILPDELSDSEVWGMTARKAWQEFVFALVERYDGDSEGLPDILEPGSSLIKTLTMGNEPEAPGHFFESEQLDPQGTVAAYKEIISLVYDTVKVANPNIIVARGKSNPGHIFDDMPDMTSVYDRRPAFFDSLSVDLQTANYDLYAINYNDHYTSLLGYVDWVREQMADNGYSRGFMVGDARCNLFPRDNFFTGNRKIMPSIYSEQDTFLHDPSSANYPILKKQWQRDKVQQTIKKLTIAAATGQSQISLQPVYLPSAFEQGDTRTYMWMYGGFFDPYVYENTNSLALAREPLYWSLKKFVQAVTGANKTAIAIDVGPNIYAYRYQKEGSDAPVVIWHEDIFEVDANTGLLKRNQEAVVDLSGVFSSSLVRMSRFFTEVDAAGLPLPVTDTVVDVHEVPLDEFPVMLYPESSVAAAFSSSTVPDISIFPNPAASTLFVQTKIQGQFTASFVNLKGQIVKKITLSGNGGVIAVDISDIPVGFWFVLFEKDGALISRKVVKTGRE